MSLHLLRFDPDAMKAHQWFAAEGLLRDDADDGYAWHALLCAAFGKPSAPKPFRHVERRGRPPQLLAYSQTTAEDLRQLAAEFADPKAIAALGVESVEGKLMPSFAVGRRLGFSLKLRPVVRRDRDGDRNRVREMDVFVAEQEASETPLDREAVYLNWARGRLEAAGVSLQALRCIGLESSRVQRRAELTGGTRELRSIAGHNFSVAGTLTVEDPARFNDCLAQGIGRHRAFGFGMLLLSPPES